MRAVTQSAPFRHGGTAWGSECAFPSRRGHRMRLCVSVRGQSALFRKLRFSSPGQTRRRLTEKRILRVAPHGKVHSVRRISRKSAFCVCPLTEKRILRVAPHGKAHSAYAPHQKTHPTCERSRTLHRRGHATTRLPTHRTPVPQALRPEVHIGVGVLQDNVMCAALDERRGRDERYLGLPAKLVEVERTTVAHRGAHLGK